MTLVWTFGLMLLFAVGGANPAIPEMHRVAVDVQHGMSRRIGGDVGDVRIDRHSCLLCEPPAAAIEPFAALPLFKQDWFRFRSG